MCPSFYKFQIQKPEAFDQKSTINMQAKQVTANMTYKHAKMMSTQQTT